MTAEKRASRKYYKVLGEGMFGDEAVQKGAAAKVAKFVKVAKLALLDG